MLLRKQDVVFTRESTGAPSVASLDLMGCVWRLTPLLRLLQLLVVRLIFISSQIQAEEKILPDLTYFFKIDLLEVEIY